LGTPEFYGGPPPGKKSAQTAPLPQTKERHVPALLAVLLLIVILAILGFAVVKVLLWVAAILLIIWLIGFFMRGAGGARWYRW
jgi:Na+/H+-translocating membrane pyrophosphatase